jgi:hypothetical protein
MRPYDEGDKVYAHGDTAKMQVGPDFSIFLDKEHTLEVKVSANIYQGGGLGCHLTTWSSPSVNQKETFTQKKIDAISTLVPALKETLRVYRYLPLSISLQCVDKELSSLIKEETYAHFAFQLPKSYLFYVFSDRVTSPFEGKGITTTGLVEYLIKKAGWVGVGSKSGGNPLHMGGTFVQAWVLTPPLNQHYLVKDTAFITPDPAASLTLPEFLGKYGGGGSGERTMALFQEFRE